MIFWNIFKLLVAAVLIVTEINVIKSVTYVNRTEALLGFLINVCVAMTAFAVLTSVEW